MRARLRKGTAYWTAGPPTPPASGTPPDGHTSADHEVTIVAKFSDDWTVVDLDTGGAFWVLTQDVGTVSGDAEVGADKSKVYGPYDAATSSALLDKLRAKGFTVTGSNPWHIDTHTHGVTLDALQDSSGNVKLTITGSNFYVSNAQVWSKIDPVMPSASTSTGKAVASAAFAPTPSSRWTNLANALAALDVAVSGAEADAVHFYPPMTEGEFRELLDDLEHDGWKETVSSTYGSAMVWFEHKGGARNTVFKLLRGDPDVITEDLTRAVLLQSDHPDLDWAALESRIGHRGASVLGAVDDWTPPATNDASGQVGYLERALEKAKSVWHDVQQYDEAKRKQTAQKLADVAGKAKALAQDVKTATKDKLTQVGQGVVDRAKAVSSGWDSFVDSLETAGVTVVTALGVGVAWWWFVIAGAAYLYFSHEKKAAA